MITYVKGTLDIKKPIFHDGMTLYKVEHSGIVEGSRNLILIGNKLSSSYFANGKGKPSVFGVRERDFGHANQPYETDLHQPYVALFSSVESYDSAADMLANGLKSSDLKDCDIIGKGFGGLVALRLIQMYPGLVHHAYLLNAPIYGSVLEDQTFLQRESDWMSYICYTYGVYQLQKFDRTVVDLWFVKLLYHVNKNPIKGVPAISHLDKFTYFSGNIFESTTFHYGNTCWSGYEKLQRMFMEWMADYIQRARGMESDGYNTFDRGHIQADGIHFVDFPGSAYSNVSTEGYLSKVYQKVLEGNGQKR